MKLTVSTRGLILVAIPLTFELVFIGTLAWMLKQSQQETAKEIQAKAIVFQTNRLTKYLVDASSDLFLYGATKSDAIAQRYDKQVVAIRDCLEQLRLLARDKPERLKEMEEITKTGEQLLQLYGKVKSAVDEGGMRVSFVNQIETKAQFQKLLRQFVHGLDKFADDARKTEEATPAKMQEREHALELVLLAGLLVSMTLAFSISMLFSRSITGRLRTMSANTARFSRGETLLPPVSGEDEIAELDGVFHQMADIVTSSQRMKQEFMAMLTHDLRSPIASMKIFLQSAANGNYGKLDQDGQEAVRVAYRNASRLVDLTDDLLEIEKAESESVSLRTEFVDLQAMCESAAESIGELAEQSGVRIITAQSDIRLQADERRLMRVVVNLLSNAIRYSEKGSAVTIKIASSDDKAIIHVIDQGPGIPDAQQALVFDRFKQLDTGDRKLAGSAGLGLAVCKSIVEAHGGQIGLTSEPGQGCDFWFTLPRKT